MAQRVEYMVLPNTIDQILLDRCVTILAYVDREKPDFKTFRGWLREMNVWKKEETPAALALVGVRGLEKRKAITLAPVGQKLLAAETPPDRKKVLFQHLLDGNPILVKYVVEALDAEAGGRLHSTHELYRYITSYAYPGNYVRLIDFQNFVKWMQAADGLKFVGIRWAIGDVGKEWLPKIRSIDVEEVLEDEALEAEEAEEDDESDESGAPAARPAATSAPETAPAAAPAPSPASTAAPAQEGDAGPPDEELPEEDLPDMPPEAPGPPIDEAAARRFEEQLGIVATDDAPIEEAAAPPDRAPSPIEAATAAGSPAAVAGAPRASGGPQAAGGTLTAVGPIPARPERTAPPVAAPVVRPLRTPALEGAISAKDRVATVESVKAWWAGFPHKRRTRAADLGFEAAAYEKDPRGFLVRLMTAAVLVDHEAASAPIADFLRRLDDVDAFARIGAAVDHGGLEAVLEDLGWFDDNLWFQRLSENLVHTARFRRRLDADPELLDAIPKIRGGKKVAEAVFQDLFGGGFYLPPFWLIRELHALGIWDRQAFAAVACVPSYRVRLSAFRLGFIDTYHADSFPTLVEMSQVLSRFFGDDCDYDAPLAQLPDGFGCQHRCPHVLDCPLACREKHSI